MREQLRSQRETVISLPTSWDSWRNRETWQVCIGELRSCERTRDLIHAHPNSYPYFINAMKHGTDVLFLEQNTIIMVIHVVPANIQHT